jgi:hypothetical protein
MGELSFIQNNRFIYINAGRLLSSRFKKMTEMLCPHCCSEQSDYNYIGLSRCTSCDRPFSVYHAEGRLLLENGKFIEAIDHLVKASRHLKNTALVFLDLARAYALTNQERQMTAALQRAFEIDSVFVSKEWLGDAVQENLDLSQLPQEYIDLLITLGKKRPIKII